MSENAPSQERASTVTLSACMTTTELPGPPQKGRGQSMYWMRFLMKILTASRAGLSCVIIGGLIQFVPTKSLLDKMVAFTTYAPTIALSACDSTLGAVTRNIWSIMQVAVFVMVETMAILKYLHPPITNMQMLTAIGLCSFIVTLPARVNMMGKKVGLAQICMTFIAARLDAKLDVVYLPIKFVASIFVGASAAFLAFVLPFPSLAIMEVRRLSLSAVNSTSDLFQTVARSFFATDASTSYSIALHSKVLTKAASEVIIELERSSLDYVPIATRRLRVPCCSYIYVWKIITCTVNLVKLYAIPTLLSKAGITKDLGWEIRTSQTVPHYTNLTKGLNKLHLYIAGMELALQSHYLLQSSKVLREVLEEPLMRIVQASNALLESARKLPLCATTPQSKDSEEYAKLIKEGKEALVMFDEALYVARKQVFYAKTVREPPMRFGPLTTARSMETVSLDRILKWSGCESKRDLDGLNHLLAGPVEDADIISPLKRKFMSRVTAYFFLFNVRLYLEGVMTLVDVNWKKSSPATVPATLERDPGPDLESGKSIDGIPNKTDVSQTSHAGEKSQPATPNGPSHSAAQCTTCALSAMSQAPRLFELSKLLKWLKVLILEKLTKWREDLWNADRKCVLNCVLKFLNNWMPTKSQTCKALKISMAMVLATKFGWDTLPNDSHCSWAPVTVAIFLGNNQGGSFRLAILRIQGTVLGSIYGYLVVSSKFIPKPALLLALFLWVTMSDYIRSSKSHGYSGVVSAQTAAMMILGDYPADIKVFAMDRVTETFVGVMCFVFVETVVFPERAVILVKREFVSSLSGLRNCVASIITAYTGHKCQSCRALALGEIRKMENKLKASLTNQVLLQAEAVAEPDLWFVPFPGDVYARLIAVQRRMLHPLRFMAFSLQVTVEENLDEHMQTLLKPLQASLIDLERQVVAAIDFIQSLFVVPRLASPLQIILKWLVPDFLQSRKYRDKKEQKRAARTRKSNAPLRKIGYRRRSVAGTPLILKASQRHFEKDFELMQEEVVAASKEAGGIIVSNSVMLSLSSLSFCLHEIMKETVEMEKIVYELLQAERPWSILDHWDDDYISKLYKPQTETDKKANA